jgi:hypothetical protein
VEEAGGGLGGVLHRVEGGAGGAAEDAQGLDAAGPALEEGAERGLVLDQGVVEGEAGVAVGVGGGDRVGGLYSGQRAGADDAVVSDMQGPLEELGGLLGAGG